MLCVTGTGLRLWLWQPKGCQQQVGSGLQTLFCASVFPFSNGCCFPYTGVLRGWKVGLIIPLAFGARQQLPSSSSGSQQRAPGVGRRDAAVLPSLAGGGSQAGGSRGPGCPRQVAGSRAGDPVLSPGQGEECPAAEVGHLNCRCGRPWSGTSSGRSGPCAGALAKVVAVWQHFSCPCLPPFSPRSEPSKAKQLLGSRQPPCARKWSPAEINIALDLGSPPHASSARTESSRALPPALLPPGPWVGTPAVPVSRPPPPRPPGLRSSSRPDPAGRGEPQFSI